MTKKSGINKEQAYHDFTTLDGGTIRFGKEGEQIFYERRGFGRTPEKNYLVTAENEIGIETNGGGGDLEIKKASFVLTKDFLTTNGEKVITIVEGQPGKLFFPFFLTGSYKRIADQYDIVGGNTSLFVNVKNLPFFFDQLLTFACTDPNVQTSSFSQSQTSAPELNIASILAENVIGEDITISTNFSVESSTNSAHGYIEGDIYYYEIEIKETIIPDFDQVVFAIAGPSTADILDYGGGIPEAYLDINSLIPFVQGGSGAYSVQYNIDGGAWSDVYDKDFVPTHIFTCADLGTRLVNVRVLDKYFPENNDELTATVFVEDNNVPPLCP